MDHLYPLAITNEPFDFIKYSEPNINVAEESYLQFIPPEIEEKFDGWKVQATKIIHPALKNIFGYKITSFEFSLCFMYGGKLNGKGNYIKNAKILVSNIYKLPSWTIEAKVKHISTKNLNKDTDDIFISILLEIEIQFKNLIQCHPKVLKIELKGDGDYNIL